jgi:hypothetical protein
MFRMSGVTPKASAPVQAPARPKPVMTSSKISRMLFCGADLAQALQVAHRRDHHAGRAGERLHDHGGDVRCIVQRDQVRAARSASAAPG